MEANKTENGVWLTPERACRFFHSGKGITKDTLMNKIYSGKLRRIVRKDDYGNWWVFIPDTIFNQQVQPVDTAIAV
jgi:hypothetical protein